jgi:hypothetical protein
MAGFDHRADFDESDCVLLEDFSLLSSNYRQGGPIIIPTVGGPTPAPREAQEAVLMVVLPAQSNVNAGDTFNITIQLQSGAQLIDGASIALDFDPTKLRVNQMTGNTTAFPVPLYSDYDNTAGTVDYAAGNFGNYPSGNIDVLVIEFEALGEILSTPLTFINDLPRETNATFNTESVLTGDVDGALQIGYFDKTNPSDGATGVTILPTLSWTGSLGVSHYEYCYDTSNDDACSSWTNNSTSTSVVLPVLDQETVYYWQVRAVNTITTTYANDTSTAYWSFTTGIPTAALLTDFTTIALPQGIQLEWQSAQEQNLLGFNLFRAEAIDGQQERINPQLILGINPGELQGNDYQYLDATVEGGKVYYYWIEWVEEIRSEYFGPAISDIVRFKVWLPLGMR